MTKKIAVINDLSGFGKCSLTAAISVIGAMGVQPCPLPTAILSAQTGYPSYFCDDYTDKMDEFRKEWKKMGVSFDGIYTGFMAGGRQIEKVFDFLDDFYTEDTFLLADPVMGDNGRRYDMFTPELLAMMKELVRRADIITPNLTELCLLTDTDYHIIGEIGEQRELTDRIEQMCAGLAGGAGNAGPKEIVVTGICYTDQTDGVRKVGNLAFSGGKSDFSSFPFIGESYSGTGDLFASMIAGGRARGDSLKETMALAGRIIELSIQDSAKRDVPRNDGVDYEQYLWMLAKRTSGTNCETI